MNFRPLLPSLARFPWRAAWAAMRLRWSEDRLGVSAGSLTFTTIIALVPFFPEVLAPFTPFPMFGQMQGALQTWLVQSLVPDAISRQVLGYLTQFATKASRLGAFGLAFLAMTALSLVLTIDRTLNAIWRVRRPRPLGQRVLVYWAVITLGPLLLAASLSLSSYLLSASRGLVRALPDEVMLLLDLIEFLLLAACLAALYRYVPNTPVRRAHAWAGALFATLGIELARQLLATYLASVPTYWAVYGTFATVPILLVWIYLMWVVILLGAVLASQLPSLAAGLARQAEGPGWAFQLALDALARLARARDASQAGLSLEALAEALRVDPVQLEPVVDALAGLDWVGRLEEGAANDAPRWVLLVDPARAPVMALADRLLLPAGGGSAPIRQRLEGLTLHEAMQPA